jgi:isoamylase
MAHLPDALWPGRPFPLGATWDGLGINFAVFSAHAERIDLCLFEPSGKHEIARYPMPEYTDQVWHGYLPDATAGLLYGYRALGPYEPERGHRFNPYKLLLDPYARALAGSVHWTDALYGFRLNSSRGDLSFDRRDSAPAMPKGVVTDDAFNWGDDRPPAVPWSDTVIYEAHLRGLTMLRDDIRPPQRGTFAALADPAVIDHLRRLGITAIELMPVHAFVQDRALRQRGLRNYWGYNTLGFFAPEPSYLSEGAPNEMRVAVRHLHAAGIEVILDVVYNHTAESDEKGPTLSFRGLDNASYYRLQAADRRRPVNDTGTGSTMNLSHPRVLQMVMDSLRHWVTSYHVDGFRFDLCATLGREPGGFDPGAGFFDAVRQDPVLAGVKLIAEPWDVGPGGYQLGNHPPGFAEWNDRFRDDVRRFWRGDPGHRPAIAAALAGSADIFARHGRRPWASVNFVTSHDGLHAAGRGQLRRKAQRSERREQSRWAFRQCHQQLGRRGADRRSGDQRSARPRPARHAGRHVLCGRHADAARRRRIRPYATGQQQRLLPGQRDRLARLADGGIARGCRADCLRGAARRDQAGVSGAAQPGLPAWQGASRAGAGRHRLVRRAGGNTFTRGVERPGAANVGAAARHGCSGRKGRYSDTAAQSDQ